MAKNRISMAWDILTNPNKNLFNEAIYRLVGGQTNTYNQSLEVLLNRGYGENPDVNAMVNQMASKSTVVPYYVKNIEDEEIYKQIKRFPIDTTLQQKQTIKKLKAKAYDSDSEMPMPLLVPNPTQTWNDILFLYKVYLKVCGNVYLYKVMSEQGKPLQLSYTGLSITITPKSINSKFLIISE